MRPLAVTPSFIHGIAIAACLMATNVTDFFAASSNDDGGVETPGASPAIGTEGEQASGIEEELVVTGSRLTVRSVTDSLVPIDTVVDEALMRQGNSDLDILLRNVVPSLNISAMSGDAAVVVRPINLRGLAPDHTLVLVNSKRRHRGAVILWSRIGVSHGAQGPDVTSIPAIALHRVEVLRDGASAQYGSDAIAGVMNFLLKDSDSGGMIEMRTGATGKGDGRTATFAGNAGLPWGENGFMNVSIEYGGAEPTLRAIQRADAALLVAAGNKEVADPAQRWGAARVEDDMKIWIHFGRLLQSKHRIYGHAGYADRRVSSRNFFYRNPNTRSGVFSSDGGATLLVGDVLDSVDGFVDGSSGCPTVTVKNDAADAIALARVTEDPNCFTFQQLFPGGFQPVFGGDRLDVSLVTGVRGETADTLWDASVSAGMNEVDFFLRDSVNASLGLDTPTEFDPGIYRQVEMSTNIDLSNQINDRVNVVGGIEWRYEGFKIGLGEEASWQIGPYADQGFSAGSNGFPGFSPIAAGEWNRMSFAIYGELEYEPQSSPWRIAAATRFEDYENFEAVLSGKLATRVDVGRGLAFRSSVGSGFRAPTPGQQNAFNVSTQWAPELMELVNNGTIPSTSSVAALRGGKQLQAEKSLNLSVGMVYERRALTLTADLFRIELDDRLGVTQLFTLQAHEVEGLLAEGFTGAANISNFRFFSNDFKTRTNGMDLVGTWQPPFFARNTRFSLAMNFTKTKVVESNPELTDERLIREIEDALPNSRWNLAIHHDYGSLDLLARLHYFGNWYDARDAWDYDGAALVDLEAIMRINPSTRFTAGLRNVFDREAGRNPNPHVIGNLFSSRAPFDTNGLYVYGRVEYRWGDGV